MEAELPRGAGTVAEAGTTYMLSVLRVELKNYNLMTKTKGSSFELFYTVISVLHFFICFIFLFSAALHQTLVKL